MNYQTRHTVALWTAWVLGFILFAGIIVFLASCGQDGPIVMHGKDNADISLAAIETEAYFTGKGLQAGWTSHQLIWIEPQDTIDHVCQRHVASCSTSPWHIYVNDWEPIKQLVKHELGHQGGFKLGHVDSDHSYWTDFWSIEQWK